MRSDTPGMFLSNCSAIFAFQLCQNQGKKNPCLVHTVVETEPECTSDFKNYCYISDNSLS